jgi:hypothetical protein
MLFVNEFIAVPNIGPFMFICIDSSYLCIDFFFWNVGSAVCVTALEAIGRICMIDQRGQTLVTYCALKQKDQTVVASSNPLINVEYERPVSEEREFQREDLIFII